MQSLEAVELAFAYRIIDEDERANATARLTSLEGQTAEIVRFDHVRSLLEHIDRDIASKKEVRIAEIRGRADQIRDARLDADFSKFEECIAAGDLASAYEWLQRIEAGQELEEVDLSERDIFAEFFPERLRGIDAALEDAGQWAQKNYPGQELEAALLRMHDYKPGVERGKGMRDCFAKEFPTGKIVSDQNSVDIETAMKATETILQANPNVKIFMANSDDTGAVGAYEVLKAKVKPEDYDKYAVIGADGTGQGIKYLKEGGMYRGDIDVLPYQLGVDAFNMIKDLVAGKIVDAKQYLKFSPIDYEKAIKDY